jgi:hypothetical protein
MTYKGNELLVEGGDVVCGGEDLRLELAQLLPCLGVGRPLVLPLSVGTIGEGAVVANPADGKPGLDPEVVVRTFREVRHMLQSLLGLAVGEVEPTLPAVKQRILKLVLHPVGRATLGARLGRLDLIELGEEELDEGVAGRHTCCPTSCPTFRFQSGTGGALPTAVRDFVSG